jgi:pSer/pThr/pTyr-binding forkhead associated (FHA) protein
MAIIKILYNDNKIDAIPLCIGETCMIGRDAANEVVIDDLTVSFHHGKIESHADGFLLVDLNSENGTFVNGKMINSVWLNDGDTINVGNHTLIFLNPMRIKIPEKLQGSINETIPMETEKIKNIELQKGLNRSNSKISDSMVIVLLHDQMKSLPLMGKPISIGKAQTNDIVAKDLWVGKKAGIIEKLADGWYFRYVGGFLRPRVNGDFSKKPVKLKEFDIISLGKTRMQVMIK